MDNVFFWVLLITGFLFVVVYLLLAVVWNTPALVAELSGKARRQRIAQMINANKQGRSTTDIDVYYSTSGLVYSGPSHLEEIEGLDDFVPVEQVSGQTGYTDMSDNDPTGYLTEEDTLENFPTGSVKDLSESTGNSTELVSAPVVTDTPHVEHGEVLDESADSTAAEGVEVQEDETPTGYLAVNEGEDEQTGYLSSISAEDETPTGYMDEGVVSDEDAKTGYIAEEGIGGASDSDALTGYLANEDNEGTSDEDFPTGYLAEDVDENASTGYLEGTNVDENAPTGYLEGTNDEDAPTGYLEDTSDENTPTGYLDKYPVNTPGWSTGDIGHMSEDAPTGFLDESSGNAEQSLPGVTSVVRVIKSRSSWDA